MIVRVSIGVFIILTVPFCSSKSVGKQNMSPATVAVKNGMGVISLFSSEDQTEPEKGSGTKG